jgi:hypothetical protein
MFAFVELDSSYLNAVTEEHLSGARQQIQQTDHEKWRQLTKNLDWNLHVHL